jgi:secreted trypsin-like serine protease
MVLKIDRLWKLIGIVSAAVAKQKIINNRLVSICDLNNYLVYTDVSKFYNWINQVVLNTYSDFNDDLLNDDFINKVYHRK